MMNSIISVNNLTKKYNDTIVVDNISFDVEKGALFSFLGTNGAGKSTTINIICTVLNASSGETYVDGLNVKTEKNKIRREIGIVYQQNVLDDLLTVSENLKFRASLYGIKGRKFDKRLDELANKLNFKKYLNQNFITLSGGQKRRVEIARAIFHNPKILLLDEPTTGLDPKSRKRVWEIIWELKKNLGMTIFLTTHYLEEAKNSDLIMVLNNGKIIAKGSSLELKNQYSCDKFLIYPQNNVKDNLINSLVKSNIKFEEFEDHVIIQNPSIDEVSKELKKNSDLIDSFEFQKGSLDDAFLNILKRSEEELH
ncbi:MULTISPECIES: ABC transporter ATP-binding protein [Leuconostoc]|nr:MULTISPECIES: ABC transporter ATP-binding protein [Leuconostoc]